MPWARRMRLPNLSMALAKTGTVMFRAEAFWLQGRETMSIASWSTYLEVRGA